MLISTQPIIKKYLDFVAGVSALAMPSLRNQAIKDQLDKYSHVMVYGEYSQSPAVEYCKLHHRTLYLNSGTEAIEGVKISSLQVEVISCHNAYHGNTMGSRV
jgi:acetylornithine/succinyldiaminopimelate/putrescine aminotransferase